MKLHQFASLILLVGPAALSSRVLAQGPDPRLETVVRPGAVISMPVDGTPDAPAVPPLRPPGTGSGAGGQQGGSMGGATVPPIGQTGELDGLSGTWKTRWTDPYAYYDYRMEVLATGNGRWRGKQTLLDTNHGTNRQLIGKSWDDVIFIAEGPGKLRVERKGDDPNPGNAGYFEQNLAGTLANGKISLEGTHKGGMVTHWIKIEGTRESGASLAGNTTPGVGTAGALGVWVQAVIKDRRPQLQIVWIEADSPAQGRLQIGDYLLTADQKPLADIAGAGALLGSRGEGASVNLLVQRGKQQQAISVPMGRTVATAERTVAIIGDFNGEWFKGRFLAFLQPVRRTCYGTMGGGGVIKLEGNFEGTWDPNSGAIQTQFDGKVKMLLRVGIKGTVNGQVDRNGHGSGTYTGTGPIGEEKGNWTCGPAPANVVGGL